MHCFLGKMSNTPEEVALLNIRNGIVGAILFFALIGLGSYLVKNPAGLFIQVSIMVVMVAFVFVIYRMWSNRQPGAQERNSYAKAAKYTRQRAKQRQAVTKMSNRSRSRNRNRPLRKRSTAHLTVIEGKKGKKKDRDRALF